MEGLELHSWKCLWERSPPFARYLHGNKFIDEAEQRRVDLFLWVSVDIFPSSAFYQPESSLKRVYILFFGATRTTVASSNFPCKKDLRYRWKSGKHQQIINQAMLETNWHSVTLERHKHSNASLNTNLSDDVLKFIARWRNKKSGEGGEASIKILEARQAINLLQYSPHKLQYMYQQ